MRTPPKSSATLLFCLAIVSTFVLAATGTATAQANGFGNPPPSSVNATLQGCSGAGNNVVPTLPTTSNDYGTSLFVCPSTDYTGGNLGKVWNELDLVPWRLTTANKAGGGTVTYSIIVAGEYLDGTALGWDEIGDATGNASTSAGPTKNPNSDGSCTATWNGFFTNGPSVGSSTSSVYRVLDIAQGDGTTCVWDYTMRLAIGSHLYPGSSLHGFTFQTAVFTQAAQDVPLPVNQIAPQALAKNMSAAQNSDHIWNITKSVTQPSGLDTCSTTANTQNITITINWQKLAATPNGPTTVITNINATNPADRDIYVAVTDNIYIGSGQTTLLGTATNVNNSNPLNQTGTITVTGGPNGVLVPAHSYNYPVLQDVQTDTTQTDSAFNDVATASYTDVVTGVPIPQTSTATASTSVIQSGNTMDETASIVETEGTRDSGDSLNLLDFSVTSHTDPSGGSYENGYVEPDLAPLSSCNIDQVVSGNLTSLSFPYCVAYKSGTLSSAANLTDSGSLTFTKSISATKTGAVATGVLGDMAKLTTTDSQATIEAEATASISADATVAFTINKTISNSATATFTFHVYDLSVCAAGPVLNSSCEVFGVGNSAPPQVSFVSGGAITNSVTINLPPSNYDVTEGALTGWTKSSSTPNPQNANLSAVNGVAPCTGSVSFSNSLNPLLTVKKKLTPSTDSGLFNLQIDGSTAGTGANVGDGGTTGAQSVSIGSHTVGETGGTNTTLSNYTSSISCSNGASGSGTSLSVTLAAGDSVTCTITNTAPGGLVIKKISEGANGTFSYVGSGGVTPTSFSITTTGESSTSNGTGSYPTSGSITLAEGTGYSVTENTPNSNHKGFAPVGTPSCDQGSASNTNITVVAGKTTTCTFTNATAFVVVKKTVSGGAIPTGLSFPFSLYYGASASSAGTLLEGPLNATSTNSTLNFTTQLIPGTTYQMCEDLGAFPAWQMPTFDTFALFQPSGANNVWCGNFTPAAGQTSITTINVNNAPPPGGVAFTIGYWKNWSSCSGGKQKHTLDLTLFNAQGHTELWTSSTLGIAVGDLALYTSPTADPDSFCKYAVDVLNKSSSNGSSFASNPAYNMAAQLLGAELNLANGSGSSTSVICLVKSANDLLTPTPLNTSNSGIDFSSYFYANKAPTKLTSTQINDMNYLQTQLNNYNNDLPVAACTTLIY